MPIQNYKCVFSGITIHLLHPWPEHGLQSAAEMESVTHQDQSPRFPTLFAFFPEFRAELPADIKSLSLEVYVLS